MGFHTPEFLILAAACVALFLAANERRRKLLVLAGFDALFYLCAGLLDFALLVGAAAVSYFCALGMRGSAERPAGETGAARSPRPHRAPVGGSAERSAGETAAGGLSERARKRRRLYAALGVGANLFNLAFFKYYYFVLGNVSRLVGLPAPAYLSSLNVVLPIGISFYTFQLIAYLVDVYRDETAPVGSFLEFWVFISFFGQVIAGPIMRAKDFVPQVVRTGESAVDAERFKKALVWFAIGLAKKLVIADSLGPFVDRLFAKGVGMSSVDVWIAAYLFGFQIYFDFSAYSDMAVGIGHLFGYDLAANFRCPYVSQNPREFWRRWHVTLSTWVRDYLYIPMGGSRKGFAKGIAAVLASMTISGLWHGAAWTFVLWGLYHGLLSAGHRVWRAVAGKRFTAGKVPALANNLIFLQFVMVGWVLFRVQDASQLGPLVKKMLTFSDLSTGPHVREYFLAVCGLYVLHILEHAVRTNAPAVRAWWSGRVPAPVRGVVYALAALVLALFLRPKPNAFIYFQF